MNTVPSHSYRIQLFIHNENQTILWNLIQSSSLWSEFARNLSIPPQEWFRQMIEKQYIAMSNDIGSDEIVRNETVVEWLQRVNKETIRQMVAVMLSRIRSAKPVVIETPPLMGHTIPYDSPAMGSPAGGQFNASAYSDINDTPKLVYAAPPRNYDTPVITTMDVERERKEKHEKSKREFDAYQAQYNSLLSKPAPPIPAFNTPILPEQRITNMDELLKQKQELREREVAELLQKNVPPPTTDVSFSSHLPVDRDNIKQEVFNALLRTTSDKGVSAKSVSWDIDPAPNTLIFESAL